MKKIIMSVALICLSSGALFAHAGQVSLIRNPETGEVQAINRSRGGLLPIYFVESKSTEMYATYKIKGQIVYVAWEDLILLEVGQTLAVELPLIRGEFKKRKELRNFARQQASRYNASRGY